MTQSKRLMHLDHRETGERSQTFDLTGWDARSVDTMWDGLVRKVDFEKWCPIYEPERGDDETMAEWLA